MIQTLITTRAEKHNGIIIRIPQTIVKKLELTVGMDLTIQADPKNKTIIIKQEED